MINLSNSNRLSRAIDGSSRAVIKGWAWGASPFLLCCLIGYPLALLAMLPYVFFTWLFVCLPLYYYQEYRCLFKNNVRCVLMGGLCGPLMLFAVPWVVKSWLPEVFATIDDSSINTFNLWGIIPAIITEAVACGKASENRDQFMYEDREDVYEDTYLESAQMPRYNFSQMP
jgi:hypothetical protein